MKGRIRAFFKSNMRQLMQLVFLVAACLLPWIIDFNRLFEAWLNNTDTSPDNVLWHLALSYGNPAISVLLFVMALIAVRNRNAEYIMNKNSTYHDYTYMWYWFSTFAISLIICMVFPNGQDLRPTEFARDNVLVDIVKILYASDTNTNVLPSMHVVGSIAAAVCVFDCKALKSVFYKIGAVVLAALISISTVFIKQHSALDIFASIVVCIPTYLFIYKGGYDKLSAWIKRRRNKNKKA